MLKKNRVVTKKIRLLKKKEGRRLLKKKEGCYKKKKVVTKKGKDQSARRAAPLGNRRFVKQARGEAALLLALCPLIMHQPQANGKIRSIQLHRSPRVI